MESTDTTLRTCTRCAKAFPATTDHFYTDKRKACLYARCKACHKQSTAAWAAIPTNAQRLYQRSKAFAQTDKGRELQKARNARFNAKPENKRRRKCWNTFTRALATRVISQLPCTVCQSSRSVAHHWNYNLPLAVTWLCRKHHAQEHQRLRLGADHSWKPQGGEGNLE